MRRRRATIRLFVLSFDASVETGIVGPLRHSNVVLVTLCRTAAEFARAFIGPTSTKQSVTWPPTAINPLSHPIPRKKMSGRKIRSCRPRAMRKYSRNSALADQPTVPSEVKLKIMAMTALFPRMGVPSQTGRTRDIASSRLGAGRPVWRHGRTRSAADTPPAPPSPPVG